jgi:hypothetical protein
MSPVRGHDWTIVPRLHFWPGSRLPSAPHNTTSKSPCYAAKTASRVRPALPEAREGTEITDYSIPNKCGNHSEMAGM